MADIGSLIVKFGADASGLQKAMADLGGSAQQFQRGLENIGKIASTAFLAAASAAIAMTIAAGKQAEELDQLATATGINTDRLQEYDVMLNRAGLSGQDLAVMLKNVAQSLDQAKAGTGTAGARFVQLGIDIRRVTSTDDLLRKIVVASGNLADGMGKTAIMTDLLGKSWQQALKMFQDGEKGLAGLSAASKNLGETLSTSQIAVLKEMDDQLDDLQTAYKRFGQQIGVSLAPNVKMITELIKDMMVVMANHAAEFGLAWDVMGTKVLHFGLQIRELSGTLFSSNIFSVEAWKKTLDSMKFIGAESDKQVARLRAAFELQRIVAPLADTRKQPPAMIDTAKMAQQAQALVDAQLKADQDLFKRKGDLAQAYFAQQQARLASNQAMGIASDIETVNDQMRLVEELNVFKAFSLNKELTNYQKFVDQKLALFTNDQKGQADKAKFEVEAAGKTLALQEQIRVAGVQSATDRIAGEQKLFETQQKHALDSLTAQTILADATMRQQDALYQQESGLIGAADAARQVAFEAQARRYDLDLAQLDQMLALKTISYETYAAKVTALEQDMDTKRREIISRYPTFVEQQLSAVVASNAFSLASIVSTWTSAIATMILHGGNLKAAWEATQQAILQSALNALVQMGVNFALSLLKNQAVQTAADAALVASHTAGEAAKTAVTTAATAARTIVIVTASKVAGAATLGEIAAMGTATIGVMQAIVVGIAGVFTSMAAALAVSIVGAPFAPGMAAAGLAALAGGTAATAAAAAAVAGALGVAAGAMAFAEGGIGDFGSGTAATLHGPEAIIPLNSRGASFLQDALGGGTGSMIIKVPVNLDGQKIAEVVTERLPSAWRKAGLPA